MYYSISHKTRYSYSAPISESVMEVRMQPRTEGPQRMLNFRLTATPRTQITSYRDGWGNTVHHFDIPGNHTQLTILAKALVDINAPVALPEALNPESWNELDTLTATDVYWDMLTPSHFARPGTLLERLARDLDIRRQDDPLTTLRTVNSAIFDHFDYAPQSTRADSPIEEALTSGRGVCQDFAHIMIALVRELHIPCRYVSGYLFHRSEAHDRSAEDATHAWVEALLPGFGWVGFDPTNNLVVTDRHIRVAVGRDYADVPPTHGIFKGNVVTELFVGVNVAPTEEPPEEAVLTPMAKWGVSETIDDDYQQYPQQQ
ncbi:MAG: transglutaminase family protein [Chloroflexota bacterium]